MLHVMMSSLLVSAGLITLTVVIHMVGLLVLMGFLQARSPHLNPFRSPARQGIFIILTVLGLVLIHFLEIMVYAIAYILVGALPDLETAIYFSTSAFTTVGFGDVAIEGQWRLLGAMEGLNGFLLIGWSTAYMVSLIGRLRSTELAWLDRMRDGID